MVFITTLTWAVCYLCDAIISNFVVCCTGTEFLSYRDPYFLCFLCSQVQAIKLLVRWLLGMKNNQSKSANSTLRLLSAMLVSEGDLTEQKKIR